MITGHCRIAWGIAAGSAAALATAVFSAWPEIAAAYHLHRLRQDPALLEAMIENGSWSELVPVP